MRKEKQFLLDEVKEQIDQDGSFAIMSYLGLSANKAAEFRREVNLMGGNVEMVRKRILIKAASAAGIELDLEQLPGHIGLVFGGEDPFATTKFIFKFSQDNNKAIQVVGGRYDGQLYNAVDVAALAQLPGKDEMRAQFLGLLEAPMAQTLSVMDAIITSVVYCLDNKAKQDNADK